MVLNKIRFYCSQMLRTTKSNLSQISQYSSLFCHLFTHSVEVGGSESR
jgi:hypothetical protein